MSFEITNSELKITFSKLAGYFTVNFKLTNYVPVIRKGVIFFFSRCIRNFIFLMTVMILIGPLFLDAECKYCLMVSDKLHSCTWVVTTKLADSACL